MKYDLSQSGFSPSGWSYSLTDSCVGYNFLGGFGKFGQNSVATKTFTGLMTHTSVTIKFTAYYIRTWDGYVEGINPYYDSAMLYINNELAFHRVYGAGSSVHCYYHSEYDPYWDYLIDYYSVYAYIRDETIYNFPHNSSSLILKFTTSLNSGVYDEAFGFSDIVITVNITCDSTCYTCDGTTANDCTKCIGNRYLSGKKCVTECPSDQYGDSATNTCKSNQILLYL